MVDWRSERDQALIALEREKRSDVRAEAAGVLVQLAHEDASRRAECVELVPRLLGDPQDPVRRHGVALAALVLPPGEAEPVLISRLADPSDNVRIEAAGQLADRMRPELRAPLAAVLQDDAFAVRFEAARGMAAIQHSAGFDVLVEGLRRDDFRFRALSAFAELGNRDAIEPVKRLFKKWMLPAFDRTQAAGVLARLGNPEGGKYLLLRCRSRRWSMNSARAIELAGEVKAEGAFEQLALIAQDRKDGARGAAARGLGRLGDPRALPVLEAVLSDRGASEELRLDAAEGLCLLGLPEARERVERALPTFSSKEARDELVELLQEHA